MPETAIAVAYLTLADVCKVEHADAEAYIVKDAVCILLVELVREGLLSWQRKG